MNKETISLEVRVDMAKHIEEAIRQQAATENGEGPLTKLIAQAEAMRANGDTVEFRLDPKTEKIAIVKIEEVEVDLGEIMEEGHATPAFADEYEDAEDAKKVALVSLSGGGDEEKFLISEEAYEWMLKQTPGEHPIPASVVESLSAFKTEDEDQWAEFADEPVFASSGSCTNDIALHFAAFVKHHNSLAEILDAIAENKWALVGEYHGCIY